jgi:hypothetical protein
MNANELANELQQISNLTTNLSDKVVIAGGAWKIRQQQAEIEALKAENQFFKDLMGDVEILRKAQEK